MLQFRRNYFLIAIILFTVEIMIALFVTDNIIRPYVGDFLVVILVYCFVRSFFKISILKAAIGTLVFAFVIEFLQYLNFIELIHLKHSRIANLVLGNLFQWIDLIAYTLGVLLVLLIERFSCYH
jgi:hypothetical protein